MGNMPTRSQLRRQFVRTNLWFECGPREMESWCRHHKAHGGFDPWTRTLSPLREVGRLDRVQYCLDSVAAGFEEGLCGRIAWRQACFATSADWVDFLAQLRAFDRYWVNERHFYAFLQVVGSEGGCITYPQIAASLAQESQIAAEECPG